MVVVSRNTTVLYFSVSEGVVVYVLVEVRRQTMKYSRVIGALVLGIFLSLPSQLAAAEGKANKVW